MDTGRKKSILSYIPGYANNAVLQLIIFSTTAYVLFWLTWGFITLLYQGVATFDQYFIPAVAIPRLATLKTHWWTIFTYGWFQFPNAFWQLLSNMLWLYCFGSVVQMLVGHKQVIPLYIYCMLTGGIVYLLAQLLPGEMGRTAAYMLGPRAGLIGMAAAAVTLTPQYRFYLTETFSIPLVAVAGIFAALMIISSGFWFPVILMLASGGIMGYAYIRLLKVGYRPGDWMYNVTGRIASTVTPGESSLRRKNSNQNSNLFNKFYEPKQGISQQRIDDILDKINQKGYNYLSAEEKDILMRAGKE
jgi:membrane associated rhomboid family serine protease